MERDQIVLFYSQRDIDQTDCYIHNLYTENLGLGIISKQLDIKNSMHMKLNGDHNSNQNFFVTLNAYFNSNAPIYIFINCNFTQIPMKLPNEHFFAQIQLASISV